MAFDQVSVPDVGLVKCLVDVFIRSLNLAVSVKD